MNCHYVVAGRLLFSAVCLAKPAKLAVFEVLPPPALPGRPPAFVSGWVASYAALRFETSFARCAGVRSRRQHSAVRARGSTEFVNPAFTFNWHFRRSLPGMVWAIGKPSSALNPGGGFLTALRGRISDYVQRCDFLFNGLAYTQHGRAGASKSVRRRRDGKK
jgi:hypothetical protein